MHKLKTNPSQLAHMTHVKSVAVSVYAEGMLSACIFQLIVVFRACPGVQLWAEQRANSSHDEASPLAAFTQSLEGCGCVYLCCRA